MLTLILRRMVTEPWKIALPSRMLLALTTKGLRVPEGGWTAGTFARDGERLVRGMHRIAQVTQRKAIPVVSRVAHGIFRRQIEKVIHEATHRGKSTLLELIMPQHEGLWAQAIERVFKESNLDASIELTPPIQSVMAQAYSRTAVLLGLDADPTVNVTIARGARDIAARVVGLNDTTREDLSRIIRGSVEDGLSVTETADRIREQMTAIDRGRSACIARTELNGAWLKGSVASMLQSESVTHVSVIGCESREADRWGQPSYQQFMYRGESTCNIQDVEVSDADKLVFHPNHTGTIVPSRFREAGGTMTD